MMGVIEGGGGQWVMVNCGTMGYGELWDNGLISW